MLFIPKLFLQELKLKYYQLMIELDQHESSYLAISKHYRAIYSIPSIQEDPVKGPLVNSFTRSVLALRDYVPNIFNLDFRC